VHLQIVDDGGGLPAGANPARDAGYGLTNMRYRVERHGGVFDIHNVSPRGLCVDVTIPIAEDRP
jgi:signal transduction histidine kinase